MKKKKPKLQFKTEIVTGTCAACNLNTLLVGIDSQFYRCISCGQDLEQKINGVIKYLKVNIHTDLGKHSEDVDVTTNG